MLAISLAHPTLSMITEFARAGGGGSGGGSGGGGGGIGGLVYVIGYIPSHWVAYWCRKHLAQATSYVVATAFALAYAVLIGYIFAGNPFLDFLLIGAVFLGAGAGLFGWFDAILKKIKLTRKKVELAAATDQAWAPDSLQARVREVFLNYQADWSALNFSRISDYTTPSYAHHVALMIAGMHSLKRRNLVENPQLLEVVLVDAQDRANNDLDYFVAQVVGSARDQLIDERTGQIIYTDASHFTEYWRFNRQGHTWLLAGIEQATASESAVQHDIRVFAETNGLRYSPDWGWLLLPQRGVLFQKANFTASDVNNHCIGLYHHILVQLFTYVPVKSNKDGARLNYTIAQAALPKNYEDIIVERKTFWTRFKSAPHGFQKLEMESTEFNSRYVVYATDVEQVTSFELLHPAFMLKLNSLPFKVNIEVADNVVYLYSLDTTADYATMLEVLKAAFDEMKL